MIRITQICKAFLCFLGIVIFLFCGCEKEVEVSGIIVGTNNLKLSQGDIVIFPYLIKPYSAKNKSVKFTSKDSSIAEVSTTGVVKANALGKTQIIVETEDGNFTETVEVTVLHGSTAGDSIALIKLCEIASNLYWDLTKSMDTWEGVVLSPNRRVLYIYKDYFITIKDPIDATIGNLSFLKSLQLGGSYWDSHVVIPPEIGLLTELEELSFESRFSGIIPKELGNLVNLKYLDIRGTDLTGNIPKELGQLTNLTTLLLSNNALTGEIPSELENLINLTYLNVRYNYLSGDIPQLLLSRFNPWFFCPQYGEGFNNLACGW